MKIINTFISDENHNIPEYTLLCLHRLRQLNPDTEIHFITHHIAPHERFFIRNNIEVVPQESITSNVLEKFNHLSWLKVWGKPNTVYDSPNYFFHRAMERIYYLYTWIRLNNFTDVFHCENDVVCYYPIKDAEIDFYYDFIITPASQTQSTMAVCYIKNQQVIGNVCEELNRLLNIGQQKLLNLRPEIDMINEMSLLKLCNEKGIVKHFNIFPNEGHFTYDPSSYGQYLGGTNNYGLGEGFTSKDHYVGPFLKSGQYKITWKDKKPFVNDTPLFNLHIHSKNLEKFIK